MTYWTQFTRSNYSYNMEDFHDFRREATSSMNDCRTSSEQFNRVYNSWVRGRRNTIKELRELLQLVHEKQKGFNKFNYACKKVNHGVRTTKTCNSDKNVDYWLSLAALVSDVVDGISSVAQAVDVDKHMKSFNKIMKKDKDITKFMYAERSRCLEQYRNVEEIVREYYCNTFQDASEKVSKELRLEKVFSDMKQRKGGGGELAEFAARLEIFFNNSLTIARLARASSAIGDYLDENPAVLSACKATGCAIVDALDTFGRDDESTNALSSIVSDISNRALINSKAHEISRLETLLHNDELPQTKLEEKIQNAIDDLEAEMSNLRIF